MNEGKALWTSGCGLCVGGLQAPWEPVVPWTAEHGGAEGEGPGCGWGHRQEPRDRSKLNAMARDRQQGLKENSQGGGGGNCWKQKGSERGGDPGPGEQAPGAAVDCGVGGLQQLPQPSCAPESALPTPCQVRVVYHQKHMDP